MAATTISIWMNVHRSFANHGQNIIIFTIFSALWQTNPPQKKKKNPWDFQTNRYNFLCLFLFLCSLWLMHTISNSIQCNRNIYLKWWTEHIHADIWSRNHFYFVAPNIVREQQFFNLIHKQITRSNSTISMRIFPIKLLLRAVQAFHMVCRHRSDIEGTPTTQAYIFDPQNIL